MISDRSDDSTRTSTLQNGEGNRPADTAAQASRQTTAMARNSACMATPGVACAGDAGVYSEDCRPPTAAIGHGAMRHATGIVAAASLPG